MRLNRRQSLQWLAGTTLASLAGAASVRAQDGKKLTILVGFPAGGAVDAVARAVAEAMRAAGYTAIVDNKGGAGGRLATDVLMAAPADGQTIMLTPGDNLTIFPHIYPKLRYDAVKDLVALATACEFQFAIAAGPGTPARDLKEFVAWAKAHPGKAAFGTPGAGTGMHFLGVQLGKDAGIDLTHVPYRGGAPALVDAIGGAIPTVFATLPALVQQHKAGKLRILGYSGENRNSALPDVPTFKESGYPQLTMSAMFVFVGRSPLSPAVQKDLATALSAAVRSKGVKDALDKAEFDPLVLEPAAISRRLQAESARWGELIKTTGYKAED